MQSGATATANADEVDDASFHCPFTPLFFPRWQKLKGWHLFYIFFIFSVACVALIYFFPLTLCVAAAPCLKDEREDLLSHDTWRGGRKHSRDEDETVGADVPVLNICTSTPAILQSVKMTEFLRLFFFSPEVFPWSPPLHFVPLWMNLIWEITCAQASEARASVFPSVGLPL